MALNYSHRPIFPAHTAEDNIVLPMRGVNEENRDGFGWQCSTSRCYNEEGLDWRGNVDWGYSEEFGSDDIADLLPADPFGMDMDISSTVTALTGWLEDLEADYRGFGRRGMGGARKVDDDLFAGFHPIWNDAMRFHSFPGTVEYDGIPVVGTSVARDYVERSHLDVFGYTSEGSSYDTFMIQTEGKTESFPCVSHVDDRTPHEALFFALGYLGVKDLLSVDRVCRSLHSAVHTDSLLWRSVQIDRPLNESITDDVLFKLCSRAQGCLQRLCLVECPKITVDGLRRVVESNTQLTEICVPGCAKLNVDGIINIVKDANSKKGVQGIKKLRIGGLYGATSEQHFNEVTLLLGSDYKLQETNRKPLFYNRSSLYLSCDDDRCLDIELCPICHKPMLVYDCPAKECLAKNKGTQVCRGCTACIVRCVDCGRCTNGNAYVENFCLEVQCSYCFKDPLKFQPEMDDKFDTGNGGRSRNFRYNS